MTKEEKIKESWGNLWDLLKPDEKELVLKNNGFFNGHNDDIYDSEEVNKDDSSFDFIASKGIRPYELEDIEHNNGWIKIDKEDDLPKEVIECRTCFYNGKNYIEGVIKKRSPQELSRLKYINEITHYQPIEKPKPPIY